MSLQSDLLRIAGGTVAADGAAFSLSLSGSDELETGPGLLMIRSLASGHGPSPCPADCQPQSRLGAARVIARAE